MLILWGFTEKSDFKGHEKPVYWGVCLKRGLGQVVDLRWGGVFLRGRGVDTPLQTMQNSLEFS